jgi:hypothetical protein
MCACLRGAIRYTYSGVLRLDTQAGVTEATNFGARLIDGAALLAGLNHWSVFALRTVPREGTVRILSGGNQSQHGNPRSLSRIVQRGREALILPFDV